MQSRCFLVTCRSDCAGEASRFVDFGDGRVGCVFEESQRPMPHRRKGRSDLRSVGKSNTFCER